MKKSLLLIAVVVLLGALLVACKDSNSTSSNGSSTDKESSVTLSNGEKVEPLSGERPDAANMETPNVPPLQPADHEGRWDGESLSDSCLKCHGDGKNDAVKIPENHWLDGKKDEGISSSTCTTCHGASVTEKPTYENGKENQ